MKFNSIQVVSIIAIFQSFFMALYFSRLRKGDKLINNILALFLAFFAILMTASFAVTAGVEVVFLPYHKEIFLIRQIAFLIGPLLYFLVQLSVKENFQFQRFDILHLLPFAASLVYFGIKLTFIPEFVIWLSDLRTYNNITILVHNLVYLGISITLLKNWQFNLKRTGNGNANSKLSWLFLIIGGTVLLWLVQVNSLFILNILNYYQYCNNMTSLYSASAFIIFNSIAYIVLTKPELFARNQKYEKSRLKTSEKIIYQKKLTEYMEKEKPYLNPLLTLTDIARTISIPHRSLSQIINESFQQHFNNYVNYYRILESKRLLKDRSNGKMTILEIAYQVGFNSKSAFNKAFKKQTGLTPSEYKKSTHT